MAGRPKKHPRPARVVSGIGSSLARRLRRLSGMSAHEIYTRILQAAGKRKDTLLHRFGMEPFSPPPAGSAALAERGRFFCDPQDVPAILEILLHRMPGQVREIVAQADRLLDHRFHLLGYEALDLGPDIDWQRDAIHGKGAPPAPWPSIPFLDFAKIGDHKVIWELSRLQFLVTLARAYRLTGDERYAAKLKALWEDWRRKNPYPLGVNWASSLEVAFRSLSLTWAAFLLEGTAADSKEFQAEIAREIALSGWYLRRFLSTYFSPNTHLLGEGVALFLLGTRYPGLPGAGDWRETGWKIACQEVLNQVGADGLHSEQSTYYNVYALDFFLHARQIAERNGRAIPKHVEERIHTMASALAEISQGGAVPRFGDDDGGRLFDGSRNRAEYLRDPLSTAAVLFGDGALKQAAPGLCEETLWLLGPASAEAFDALPAAAAPSRSVALPDTGIYSLVNPGPPVTQLFVDGGPHGWHSAGHGHADALSVQLAGGGKLWLADPGTYCYLDGEKQREKFRGTLAHNTLAVDGRDQADCRGPFSWGPQPQVETCRWVASDAFALFEGRHLGYQRLSDPVLHRRWVVRFGRGMWLVRDAAEGSGTHRFDISWHFGPGLEAERKGQAVIARRDGECLALLGTADDAWRLALDTDDYSPAYGARVAAPVARWSASAACPAEFATAIALGAEAAEASLTRTDDGDGVTEYRYTAAGERLQFFFAAGDRPWRSGAWASDAAVLCFREETSGIRELAAAGASYVEYAGTRAIESRERQSLLECRDTGSGWRIVRPGNLSPDAGLSEERAKGAVAAR